MSAPTKVTADTAKLPLMLTALRLPTFANLWPAFADRADREGCRSASCSPSSATVWPTVRRCRKQSAIVFATPNTFTGTFSICTVMTSSARSASVNRTIRIADLPSFGIQSFVPIAIQTARGS